jgi:phage terminase large subunit GpA-like protein
MCLQIANAERLAMQATAAALEPEPPIDYLTWAEANVVFAEHESQFPGPYNRERFPYFDEILRALSPDDPCRIVTLMGSAQIGKTVCANIFTLGSLVMGKGTFLAVHPTDTNAELWSKMKLAPMMRGIDQVRRLFPQRSRDVADSVTYKERRDGQATLRITGANSAASLSQITIFRQIQDDLSKWEVNTAGDPETQADSRSRAVDFAKIFKASTPLVLPGCRISKSFEAGSQEYPYVPCPHCAEMQVLEWDNMLAALDPEHPENAHFTCVACGCEIHEHHRPQMLKGFEWRSRNAGAKRQHRSFWIWSAYSYLQGFEQLAREWLKAKGDSEQERVFANDSAGRAWRAQSEAPPWEKIRDRAAQSHYPRGNIPAGALVITLGIDCQGDRVEWQAVGWGREYRRFVIDCGVIPGHISDATCRERLDALMVQTWVNAAGRRIGIDLAAIDGNAWTEDVWGWAKRHPRSKLIMVRGRGEDSAPRIARVKRERNERTGKILKYVGRFFHFGASIMKMALYRDLAKEDPLQPGYVSFPRGLEDEYFRQLTAERREPVKRHGFTVYRWTKDETQANEMLDTMNQAETAATKFGVRGMPDASWLKFEQEREVPLQPSQGDIEDLIHPGAPRPVPPVATTPARVRGRRVVSAGIA